MYIMNIHSQLLNLIELILHTGTCARTHIKKCPACSPTVALRWIFVLWTYSSFFSFRLAQTTSSNQKSTIKVTKLSFANVELERTKFHYFPSMWFEGHHSLLPTGVSHSWALLVQWESINSIIAINFWTLSTCRELWVGLSNFRGLSFGVSCTNFILFGVTGVTDVTCCLVFPFFLDWLVGSSWLQFQ